MIRIMFAVLLLAGCASRPDQATMEAEAHRRVIATHAENQRDEAEAMDAYTRVLIGNNPGARPSDWAACNAQAAMVVGNFHAHETVRQGCLDTRLLERAGR
jgi:hypothetical protein